jgi:integrase
MAQKTISSKTPIKDFLNGCRTVGTAYAYRGAVLLFIDTIYPEENIRGTDKSHRCYKDKFPEYEALAYRYLRQKRDNKQDVIDFIKKMQETSTPSKTIKVKVTGVREFFSHYDIVLDEKAKKEIKKVSPARSHRETNFDYMTVDKIQAVLPHLDIRLRAIVLCLTSSGARIGELLSLTMGDLDLNSKPISFYIRYAKNGESRKAYLTQEAGEALRAWFSVRSEYLKNSRETTNPQFRKGTPDSDKRVFPFNRAAVYRQYDRALLKAGLYRMDDKTNRNTLNIHRLRAFFRETIAPIIGVDAAELLLGHIDPYENAYRGMTIQKLEEKYLQCEEALTISSNKRIERDMKVQANAIKEQNSELETLRGKMQELTAENEELKRVQKEAPAAQDVDAMKEQLAAQVEQMNILQDTLAVVMQSLPVDVKKAVKQAAKEGKKIAEPLLAQPSKK